jgi:hypothetical protein
MAQHTHTSCPSFSFPLIRSYYVRHTVWLSFPAIDAQHYVSADAARGVLKPLQPPVITLGFHSPFPFYSAGEPNLSPSIMSPFLLGHDDCPRLALEKGIQAQSLGSFAGLTGTTLAPRCEEEIRPEDCLALTLLAPNWPPVVN